MRRSPPALSLTVPPAAAVAHAAAQFSPSGFARLRYRFDLDPCRFHIDIYENAQACAAHSIVVTAHPDHGGSRLEMRAGPTYLHVWIALGSVFSAMIFGIKLADGARRFEWSVDALAATPVAAVVIFVLLELLARKSSLRWFAQLEHEAFVGVLAAFEPLRRTEQPYRDPASGRPA